MGYKRVAFFGISWMMALNIAMGGLSVIKIAIVARILSPADFGVFGIALLSLSLIELLTETGVGVVLIQSKQELSHYLDSAWIVSILRGFIITASLVIISPFIAGFFNSPQSLYVLLLISVAPFIRGFINPSEIIFQKELRFNYEFIFRLSIALLDALVAVILAIITKSVFSLVWGMLAGIVLELVVSFVFIKPRPKLKWDKGYFSEIFHKGKWVTLYGIFNYIAQNADDIFVGRILGAYTLGIYQLAYKIATFSVNEITNVINQVFFPLYSKISDDKGGTKRVFLKSTFALSVVVIPTSIFIFIFSKEIILIFLGSKWLEAVSILRVLAFYGMLRAIVGYPSSLFLALSRQKFVAYMTFSRATALCVTLLPLIYFYGVIGAAYSAIISVLVETPIAVYLLIKIFKEK